MRQLPPEVDKALDKIIGAISTFVESSYEDSEVDEVDLALAKKDFFVGIMYLVDTCGGINETK